MIQKLERLLEMCKTEVFDIAEAKSLISEFNINESFNDPTLSWEHRTTFLTEACSNSNLKMVKLLLESGADPNFILYADKPCWMENAFWDLQYPCDAFEDVEENSKTDEKRLRIAQLMLEYGVDPCIVLEEEDLFSYVLFAVFNDDSGHLLEYRSRFFILLIAYGGKNSYCTPEILKPFDKNNLLQYNFLRVPAGDGYHLTGEIVDENYEVVAKV